MPPSPPPTAHQPADSPAALQLQLPADRSALNTARLAVLAHLAGHAVSSHTLFRLELVLEELLMNLIEHAQPGTAALQIGLSLSLLPQEVQLVIQDNAAPFDPVTAPLPAAATSIATATPGGRGLLLVRQSVKSLHYERLAQGGNCVRACFARNAPGAAQSPNVC